MTNYLPTRKIKQVEIPDLGIIFIKQPTIATRLRVYAIVGESDQERGHKMVAEAIAACLVNTDGELIFETPQQVIDEMPSADFDLISIEVMKTFQPAAGLEKNSDQTPLSSQPSNLQEN